MPDKRISELIKALQLNDEDLLLIEQQGEAKAMLASVLKQFAAESAKSHAAEAKAQADRAEVAADNINLDEVYSRIAEKGDNLEFDADEEKLYLTANGMRISDGITIVTSGGGSGGGGSTNNATMTLSNSSGWIYKTVSDGAACPISFTWSSTEDGLETGPGVLRITINGAVKHQASVNQGYIPMDIGAYLSTGSNSIAVNVVDVYGNSRTIKLNVTSVALTLTSAFDNTVPYTGAFNYVYTPTGAAAKVMHFILDGVELPTVSVTTSGRQQTQAISAQSHGSHTLEVYFTAEIDGTEVESNRLFYDIICLEDGNTTPVIATDFNGKTAEQYDSIVIPYRVYDPASLTAAITLNAPDLSEPKPLTVDRTVQEWTYRADTAGAQILTITCGKTVKRIAMTISESKTDVDTETDSLALHLSSYGRSNAEDNPGTWESGDIAASFAGFNFVSDGWINDDDGITALRVTGDARLTIPLQLFAKDCRTTGKTIEIEFATRDILDYDAVIMSCFSGNRGLRLTAQRALLKSEQSEISTQYKEDEHVRLAFVVTKRSAYRLLQVYINGILSGVTQYPDDDDFAQGSPVGISIGSNACTMDLYTIRVYDNDLTRFQVLDNWIADTQLGDIKAERWKHNDVFDEYGQIVIDQLPKDLPYLVIQSADLPTSKGNKITVKGYYVDPTNSKKSFTFENAEADVQGTSSAGYARKNYKIAFNGGFTNNDGATAATYVLGTGNVPTNTFTFKADVASSEGANNVELVRLYNDICPYKTPAQEANAAVRQGIDGYPIVIFQDDGTNVTFIGKYNFNHDKATPEVFGFDSNDESWEIRNNTSDRVVWKNADFTGTDWLNDFEGRYPDKNTDSTNLAALAAWIKSTDTTGQSETEKATRLAKFKAELGDWMDIDSTLFYYLFTELFLMVDSRAKNAFPTRYDGGKWCWLPYDMDTALGINNEGALTFGYHLEDTDLTSTGADVYNGQQSVLWNNVRDCFGAELMEMYQGLRSDKLLTYDDVAARFENHQAKWPEAIFNEDSFYKYLEPLFEDNTASYLGMLQGSKAEQRKWWLYNRFRYMDAKYNAGDALEDFVTVRGYAKNDLTVTPYADIYAAIKYGSYLVQKRALRADGSQTLECPLSNVNDTETYIYSASQLAEITGLDGYMVGYADFSMATKLQSLKLGDSASTYSNTNLIELYLGNNRLLKTLDVRNCPNLGQGANEEGNVQQTVDLSGCTNIEHIYFEGTAIKGVTLPVGGILKTLHLPGTVSNLTIRNQRSISDFVMPDYSGITTLRLENVSATFPIREILAKMADGSRVRIIGFDWSYDSAADVLAFCDSLDAMRGLDEHGNNTDSAQIAGTVRVPSITGSQMASIQSRYPNINVVYDTITSFLYYYNHDGSEVLQIEEIVDGGNGTYAGDIPTREADAQYSYVYAGWSRTPDGDPDDTALLAVTADRSVYAAYTKTLQYYTVRFMNGSTVLETVNVGYGGTAVYSGDTPVYDGNGAEDYEFTGWSPSPVGITGATDCYAQYKYTGILSVKFVERTISGDYVNDRVAAVGMNAFAYCNNLTSVTLPNVTTVGIYGFRSCTALKKVDLASATSIAAAAFEGCNKLDTFILRANQICELSATGAFSSTPIKAGTGYIYVPRALLSDNDETQDYRRATNWSTYAEKFRAIEDYPDICGG